jgi:hypothetical protein
MVFNSVIVLGAVEPFHAAHPTTPLTLDVPRGQIIS